MRERENYRELILENIEYDYLCRDDRLDRDMLNELVELMVDTVCSRRIVVPGNADRLPAGTDGIHHELHQLIQHIPIQPVIPA